MGTQGKLFVTGRSVGAGLLLFFIALCTLRAESNPTAEQAFHDGRELCNKHAEAEAIPFFEKAVALDPRNTSYLQWLGYAYYETKRNAEALDAYKKAYDLDKNDRYTRGRLAQAYARAGNKEDADDLMDNLLREERRERRRQLERIAFAYHEGGDDETAVYWWKEAALTRSLSAYRWLAWAYGGGHGVDESTGTSWHYRRLAAGKSTLIPRLPNIDYLIQDTDGWVLVLTAFLTASIVPFVTVTAVGATCAWLIGGEKNLHWTEIARRRLPLNMYFILAAIVLALTYLTANDFYPADLCPFPLKQLRYWLLAPLILSIIAAKHLCDRFFQDSRQTFTEGLVSGLSLFLIYGSPIIILSVMAILLDPENGIRSGLIIITAMLAIAWLNCGGLNRLARWLRLLTPADPSVRDQVHKVAARLQHTAPTVWQFRSARLNALALPLTNEIWMVGNIAQTLTPAELETVIAHEMAHLQEPPNIQLARLAETFLFVPLFTMPVWTTSDNRGLGLILSLIIYLLGKSYLQKMTRRMEESADSAGNSISPQTDTYAHALEKLYQSNLVPAVMRQKKLSHPDLYDRMVAAGVTPDYPRPLPPGSWHYLALLATVVLNVIGFALIWLLLF